MTGGILTFLSNNMECVSSSKLSFHLYKYQGLNVVWNICGIMNLRSDDRVFDSYTETIRHPKQLYLQN